MDGNSAQLLVTLLLIGIGILSICGGALNWDWFMNNSRARLVSSVLGRNGARLFYIILGVFLILYGLDRGGVIDIFQF